MKIMAVDFGAARTGLAVCDKIEFMASPAGVINERDFSQTMLKVSYAASEYGVEEIIVGHPLNMDGSAGEKAELCQTFVKGLEKLVEIPVRLWDERQTTMQATAYLNASNVRGKKRKDVIDQVAATIILESYLAFRKNNANKQGE
ncbi:MAG: Holliday junction resolvase RuvX [Oscillospiraceae bacterium]